VQSWWDISAVDLLAGMRPVSVALVILLVMELHKWIRRTLDDSLQGSGATM